MFYLYLDESGDLGYQLDKVGSSRHFVITILEVSDRTANKAIEKAVARTIRNKIRGKLRRHPVEEIKGAKTSFEVKQYFYRQIETIPFTIYSTIIDKTHFVKHLKHNKKRVYNFVTHLALKAVPLERASTRAFFTLSKSKNKPEIREFNSSLITQLKIRVPPHVPLTISHDSSQENKMLQAVDLFVWGIYRKYEFGDTKWFDLFQKKIRHEELYRMEIKKESEP